MNRILAVFVATLLVIVSGCQKKKGGITEPTESCSAPANPHYVTSVTLNRFPGSDGLTYWQDPQFRQNPIPNPEDWPYFGDTVRAALENVWGIRSFSSAGPLGSAREVADKGSAQIRFNAVQEIPGAGNPLGTTFHTTDKSGHLAIADVYLLSYKGFCEYFHPRVECRYNPASEIDRIFYWKYVQETGAHELGHALGIIGHSTDPKDLMYPSYEPLTAEKRLATDSDRNTLAFAYCPDVKP